MLSAKKFVQNLFPHRLKMNSNILCYIHAYFCRINPIHTCELSHSFNKIYFLFLLCAQGMYTLSNVASGDENHKEAVMKQLLPQSENDAETILVKFLQSGSNQLRTAAVWTIVNLTFPSSPGACGRVTKLWNAGVVSQLKNMVNDPCLDVKVSNKYSDDMFELFY